MDHVNVYALKNNDGWTVIDRGIRFRRGIAIWEALLQEPLADGPVDVLVTHHHPDHVGMAGWFQKVRGARLTTTRTAWLYARMLTLDVQDQWSVETPAFYREAGMVPGLFERRRASRPYKFADTVFPLPLGFRRIRDGDRVLLGGRNWRVVKGDGHSPEQTTLWPEDDPLVIAGDQVLPDITPNLGVSVREFLPADIGS
ncbi:MAG: MBL fold metallo-hydrolase [Gammaproteobacteria bacterium]|nr:MBL fold metallo-hydrolase [Gammaproteobacteria bacterium]